MNGCTFDGHALLTACWAGVDPSAVSACLLGFGLCLVAGVTVFMLLLSWHMFRSLLAAAGVTSGSSGRG